MGCGPSKLWIFQYALLEGELVWLYQSLWVIMWCSTLMGRLHLRFERLLVLSCFVLLSVKCNHNLVYRMTKWTVHWESGVHQITKE